MKTTLSLTLAALCLAPALAEQPAAAARTCPVPTYIDIRHQEPSASLDSDSAFQARSYELARKNCVQAEAASIAGETRSGSRATWSAP